jgi:hypothetical protein
VEENEMGLILRREMRMGRGSAVFDAGPFETVDEVLEAAAERLETVPDQLVTGKPVRVQGWLVQMLEEA